MPAAVAVPLITGGITAGPSLFGANKQANAASDAAAIQAQAQQKIAEMNANAQKYAADLAANANAQALNFSKANAENAFANSEVARAGNYDQWAAAQRRVGSVGKLLGFGDRAIPDYRPGVDPNYTGAGGGSSLTAALPTSFGNLSDPSTWMGLVQHPSQLSSFVQGIAPTMDPSLVSYYVQKIQGQPGANPTEQAGSAQYWANKIINDPTLAGAGQTPPSVARTVPGMPATTTPNPYAVATYLG